MSLLSDFIDSVASDSFEAIGTVDLVTSGMTLQVVMNQTNTSKDYEDTGFRPTTSSSVVAKTSDITTPLQLKQLATLDGVEMRIGSIQSGKSFTTIELTSHEKS